MKRAQPRIDRGAAGSKPAVAGPELLPTRLAKACTRVLPMDGAGISMFTAQTMRIPIGASDDDATIAERLQFTVAQGPCSDAPHRATRDDLTSLDTATVVLRPAGRKDPASDGNSDHWPSRGTLARVGSAPGCQALED